jgi:hypothetical protein
VLFRSANREQWLMGQYDLTPFAGQTVQLFFGVNNDGIDGRMAMVVDNVTVSACSAGATGAAAAAGSLATAAERPSTGQPRPAVTELTAQTAATPAGRGARAAVLAGVVAAGVVLSAMIFNGRRALG